MKNAPRIMAQVILFSLIALGFMVNRATGVEAPSEDQDLEGKPCAQYDRGVMLVNSQDPSPHFVRAFNLFSKASYANEARAQYALGSLYLRGWGGPRDAALAYAWIALSAEPGDERIESALNGLRQQMSKPMLDLAEEKRREISAKLPALRIHCPPGL